MKKIYLYILGLVSMTLVQGCYEDKGNYDYHAVNEMKIEIPEAKIRMPKVEPATATLTPKLTQTLAENEDNLTFEWKKLKEGVKIGSTRINDYEDYSTGKVCQVEVEPNNPESIGMMLIVSDKTTGQKWYQLGKVAVVKPLNPAWFVLQENAEQKGVVGAVEGDANGFFAYSDVFKSETGTSFALSGKPLTIAAKGKYGSDVLVSLMNSTTVFANLTIATDKEIATYSPSTLLMMYGTNKIMFENTAKNEPVHLSYYKMDKKGEMFVTDKKAYFAFDDGWCVPFSITDTDVDGTTTVYPRPACFASFGNKILMYDETNHRFRIGSALSSMTEYMYTSYYYTRAYRKGSLPWTDAKPLKLRDFAEDADGIYAFNPNQVDASLKLLDILRGGDNGSNAYAVMAADGASELTIFRCNTSNLCAGKYTIPVDASIDLSTAKFAASQAYSAHFVFMATGNSVYRIDMERQKIEKIYTYEADANAQIACLKFRDSEDADNGNGMVLGFGINTSDGKGYLGELQLTIAGDVERSDNAVYIFQDAENPFDKIVDISYNYE